MKTKAHTLTRTARPVRPVVPVRRPQPPVVQPDPVVLSPSLTVGAVNDPAEREAETMAARVVGASPANAAPVTTAAPAAVAPIRRDAQSQPNLDELTPVPAPAEQQDFELPAENDVATNGLDAADMGELESGDPVDTGGVPEGEVQASPAAVVGRMGGPAPADVSRLVANPGPGRPLPGGLRARVEPHFGTSFKDVRLHDSPADQDAAARIGARAFAHKNRIWLGHGESPTNTRLMAHELTHVVQQTQGAEALPLRREPVRREEAEPESGGFGSGAIEALARYVPGYTLITVIMGRTLFSGKKVLKTATNLLGGLFGLHPLGTVLFDKLRETRMVEEAFQWVQNRLGDLNLTWSRLKGVIAKALSPPILGAKEFIIEQFMPLVRDITTFAVDVGKKVLEFTVRGALKLAGPFADKVWAIIQQAGDVLELIVENPLAFAKNLIKAVVGGFMKFGANILQHLKKGLLGWLFGAIAGAGITLPAKFDFKGLMSLVMQILGLTYATFRAQLVKQLGPSGERKVSLIEKSVEIVRVLLKEGFAGIWQKMLEMIENFKSTLIGGISSMVITTVIKAGISWLAGLSNPVGAVVKVVLGIYDLIVAFLERLQQIMDVAQSIFSSVGAIARGQTEAAANFVEQTIGRTVPVVIAFLAAALGLGGISSKIKAVITKLQAPVKKAMGKMIAFVIKKAKALFSKLIGKLNGKRKLPSAPFMIGKTPHRIYAERDGRKLKFMIASEQGKPARLRALETQKLAKSMPAGPAKDTATQVAGNIAAMATALEQHTGIDTQSQRKNVTKDLQKVLKTETDTSAAATQASAPVDTGPGLTSALEASDVALLRLKVDRLENYEANFGTYGALEADKARLLGDLPEDERKRYESDHVIEKAFPKHILMRLVDLNPKYASRDKTLRALPARGAITQPKVKDRKRRASNFGKIGASGYNEITDKAEQFPAIATYKPSHKRVTVDGVGAARTLVSRAAGSDDPHTTLREGLRAQLAAEHRSVLDAAAGDPDAPAWLPAKIDRALAYIEAENKRIYDLEKDGALDLTPDPTREIAANDTAFYMSGGGTGPAFKRLEGRGGRYRGLSGHAGFIENDHILEQGHVNAVKPLPLLTDGHQASLRSALLGSSSTLALNAGQQARLSALLSAPLFHETSPIGAYDGSAGYAIPLEKGLADRVTALARGRQLAIPPRPDLGGKTIAQLAQYVRNGKVSDFRKAAKKLQRPIRLALTQSTREHADIVQSAYDQEAPRVVQANPDNSNAALEEFRHIRKNVRHSLVRAKTETALLFQTPIPPS